jgi:hypothetical protein
VADETIPHTRSLDQPKKPRPIFIIQEDGSSQVSPARHVVQAV